MARIPLRLPSAPPGHSPFLLAAPTHRKLDPNCPSAGRFTSRAQDTRAEVQSHQSQNKLTLMGRSPRIGIKRRLALKARDNWCSAGQAMSGEAAPHDSLGRSPRNGQRNYLALKARFNHCARVSKYARYYPAPSALHHYFVPVPRAAP
jgi:hypothetical protein